MLFKYMPYLYMDKDEGGAGSTTTDSSGDTSGKVTTQTVDWTKIDVSQIPDDLIKKTSAYAQIKDEAIQNRLRLKPLKEQLATMQEQISKLGTDGESSTEETDVDSPDQEKNAFELYIEQYLKPVRDQFDALKQERLAGWQEQAAKTVGITSPTITASLQGNSYADVLKVAKTIADEQHIAPPAHVPSGGHPAQERSKDILEKAKGLMIGKGVSGVYDKSVHEALGGGIVED